MASFSQVAYRFRNDNGTETTATWRQDQNVADTVPVDTNFRVRFEIQNTGTAGNNKVWQLQYNLNSAGWVNVTNASSVIRTVGSPNLADAANLTNQLTVGTGTFQGATGFDEGNGAAGGTSMDVAANGHAEAEFSVQVRSANVVNGDSIGLRVSDAGTALPTYTVNATLTASAAATGTSAVTESPLDAAALTGSILIEGTASSTDPPDILASTGVLSRNIGKTTQLNAALWPSRRYSSFLHSQPTTGDLASTDTNDSITAPWTGEVAWSTNIALLEAPDVAALVGIVITQGDLAVTEAANDIFVAVGGGTGAGDLISTDPIDGAAISGDIGVIPSKKTQLTAASIPGRRYGDFARIQQAALAVTEATDVAVVDATVYSLAALAANEVADILRATSFSRGRFTQLNATLIPSRRYGSFSSKSNSGQLSAVETKDAAALAGGVPLIIIGDVAAVDPQTFIGLVDENGNHILDSSGNWIGIYVCADAAAATGTIGVIEFTVGDLASTDTPDAAVANATIITKGTIAATDAIDTPVFTGTLGVNLGNIAASEHPDAFASTSTTQWIATLASTEAPDQAVINATSQFINNYLDAVDLTDTLIMSGSVLVEGYMDSEEVTDHASIWQYGGFRIINRSILGGIYHRSSS